MSTAQANQNLADSLKVPATPDTPFFNKYDNAPETPGFTQLDEMGSFRLLSPIKDMTNASVAEEENSTITFPVD